MLVKCKSFSIVEGVCKDVLMLVKCKSFSIVEGVSKDVLMLVKLSIYLSVVKLLQPFLTKYQTVDLRNTFVSLKNFNIMKSEYILKITPPYQMSLFNFKDKKCLLSKVSLGFIADRIVKELIHKSEVTERHVLELRHETQNFIFLMVENLVTKTPINLSWPSSCGTRIIDNLLKTADELAEQAEKRKTENINLIVQSNSFRETAKEKVVELQKLEKKIQEISKK
ncbi:hypothetical protein PR048_020843 [Dryococelus australis]|uniref:Uncharacterized protein n=1 Tax=Dryococelus australis TaxID=614101 RepID=A0ABQ9GWL8_9NEOP|nr:hypothetical protein PR048_020843 [Dryococelus australis]